MRRIRWTEPDSVFHYYQKADPHCEKKEVIIVYGTYDLLLPESEGNLYAYTRTLGEEKLSGGVQLLVSRK